MVLLNDNDRSACAWLRQLVTDGHLEGHVDERPIQQLQPAELADCRQVHLFCGIGGWPLALKWAGWPSDRPVWTGSCPCQPFSSIGKQQAEADERHLWPYALDLIRVCKPPVMFGEQVASHLGAEWLAGVFADLEQLGYRCAGASLPAIGVGSPHTRNRLYWVADRSAIGRIWRPVSWAGDCGIDEYGDIGSDCSICGGNYADCDCPGPTQDGYEYIEHGDRLYARPLGDTDEPRLEGHDGHGQARSQPGRVDALAQRPTTTAGGGVWGSHWANAEPVRGANGAWRWVERGVWPLADGVPGRVALLRGAGNAIVPQVAAAFIRAFLEAEGE